MPQVSPELRTKFVKFRELYETARSSLVDEGEAGHVVASRAWDEALSQVPLTAEELKLYKLLVALHAVNGGELFGNEDP